MDSVIVCLSPPPTRQVVHIHFLHCTRTLQKRSGKHFPDAV